MRIATIKIRNKKTGRIIKINEYEWAGDLGVSKYAGWERAGGEKQGEETPKDVAAMRAEDESQYQKKNPEPKIPVNISSEDKEDPPKSNEVAEGLPKPPSSAGVGRGRGRRGGRH